MLRRASLAAALALAVALPGGAAGAATTSDRTSYTLKASYTVQVNVEWEVSTLDVTTDMDAVNTSGGPVGRLELNTIAARLGSMRMLEASVDGTAVTPRVSDQTILVTLPAALAQGDHVWVHTRYRARLLSSSAGHDWLWSRKNGVASVYRFIPWLSRRTPFDRPNDGDPFVTPVADDVRVTFTSTAPLLFATSGVQIAGGEHGQTFDARDVRDFSFTASPDYRVLTATAANRRTEIRVVAAPSADRGCSRCSSSRGASSPSTRRGSAITRTQRSRSRKPARAWPWSRPA